MPSGGQPNTAYRGIVTLILCFYILPTAMIHGSCFPSTASPRYQSASSLQLILSKQVKQLFVDNEHCGRDSRNPAGSNSERARRKCAEDILRYLGPKHQRATIPKYRQAQLQRSIRPLVGGASNSRICISESLQRFIKEGSRDVLQLATVASHHGYEAVLQMLAPQQIEIPDVEGARAAHCQLGKYPFGQRFKSKNVNQYLALLFHMAAAAGPCVGANVSLNRFDLFHGHLFYSKRLRRLGALFEGTVACWLSCSHKGPDLGKVRFHAREYPAYNPSIFPVNLGYCQTGSPLKYDQGMNLRNFLWLGPSFSTNPRNGSKGTLGRKREWNRRRDEKIVPGVFCVLDASEGTVVYEELVHNDLRDFRTVYEGDFGDVIGDINYFMTNSRELPEERIYVC